MDTVKRERIAEEIIKGEGKSLQVGESASLRVDVYYSQTRHLQTREHYAQLRKNSTSRRTP